MNTIKIPIHESPATQFFFLTFESIMGNDQSKYIPLFGKISELLQKSAEKKQGHSGSTSYSRLAMRLERELVQDGRGCSLLVMSAEYDRVAVEATTELAWHLAEELGHSVLLVDGTFNATGLTKELGVEESTGLRDLMACHSLCEEVILSAVQQTAHPRISFVPIGHDQQNRFTPLRGGLVSDFLSITCSLADFVLVQGPAVSNASRSLAFSSLVDAVLLVALEGESSFAELGESKRALTESGAKRIGLVMGVSRSGPA